MLSCAGIFFCFLAQVEAAGPVPQYQIQARVDVPKKQVVAHQVVTFTNTSSSEISEVVFHIYPNRLYSPKEVDFMYRYGGYFKINPFPTGYQVTPLRFTAITSQGQALKFSVEGEDRTLLTVALTKAAKPGETLELVLDFEFTLPHAYGRFGWYDHIIKLSHWYPLLAVQEKDGWNKNPFYPFHRPFFSEAADYQVQLTVPEDQVVIHSGIMAGEQKTVDGMKVLSLKTPQPVREFTAALSSDYQVLAADVDGVKVKSFYLPGDEKHAELALQCVRDLMKFYASRFGAYPYPEFSIAPVHLGYGGEQHSNLIFIDTRVYQLPGLLSRYFDFIVAHETGHQWFYNQIGVNEYTQMWLEEGVNSFFVEQYLDDKYGKDADVLAYPPWIQDYRWALPQLTFPRTRDYRYKMIVRIGYDHPVISNLSSFHEPSSIFSLTYGKGARILGMLRTVIGDAAFDRVFKRISVEYRFKNLDLTDFVRICEEESGQKLGWFFDQWLKTSEYLDYAVVRVNGDKISLANLGGIKMPAEVRVAFSDGTSTTLVWSGEKEKETLSASRAGARIQQVTIDPAGKLLDIDRTDNNWPRKLVVKPVPLYFGLYDVPLFLPEDSYNVVVGPEVANGGVGLKASLQKPYDQILYAGSDYEFGEALLHSRVGYQVKNVFKTQTSAGVEVANTTDYDGGQEDLVSGKIYLRRELWPAAYSLTDLNDHITLYMIRNQRLGDRSESIEGREYDRNLEYSRRKEAIVGTALHLDHSGPSPDPRQGMKLDWQLENAGHYLEATQYFYRSALDTSFYFPVTPRTTLAARTKYGWGYPREKDLYQLGGMNDLRGYGRKSFRGSHLGLGSLEYRFPLVGGLKVSVLDHLLGLESVGGVVFVDAGQTWYEDIADGKWKKDAGVGLRCTVNFGSMLEKVIIRLDAAQAINEPKADPHFWFGVSHAF